MDPLLPKFTDERQWLPTFTFTATPRHLVHLSAWGLMLGVTRSSSLFLYRSAFVLCARISSQARAEILAHWGPSAAGRSASRVSVSYNSGPIRATRPPPRCCCHCRRVRTVSAARSESPGRRVPYFSLYDSHFVWGPSCSLSLRCSCSVFRTPCFSSNTIAFLSQPPRRVPSIVRQLNLDYKSNANDTSDHVQMSTRSHDA